MADGIEIPIDAIDNASGTIDKVDAALAKLATEQKSTGDSSGALTAANGNQAFSWTELKSALDLVQKPYEVVRKEIEAEIEAAAQAAEVNAKVQTIIANQAGAVGATTEQFKKWAEAMSESSGVSRLTIENAEAMAASLGGLSGEQIPRTTQAALDMAAVMGGDVQSSLTMIAGILETNVVPRQLKFSAALKEEIKAAGEAGDKDRVLALVLGELEQRYHGAASAQDEAGTGADDLKNATEELRVSLGSRLLPVVHKLNEAMADSVRTEASFVEDTYNLADAEAQLGYTTNVRVAAYSKLKLITNENRDAIEAEISASRTQDAIYAAYAQQAAAVAGAEAKITPNVLANSQAYQGLLGIIGSMQSAENTYTTKSNELTTERTDLLRRRALVVKQGYDQEGDSLASLDKKLAENSSAVDANAKQHDLASKQIVLGYLEQYLAADGLTGKELDFLLKTGEQWGIYTADVVAQAQAAQRAAQRYSDTLNNIPTHIRTVLELIEASGSAASGNRPGIVSNQQRYAAGGSFIIPPEYGSEGFVLGRMGTASAGERVTVTPQGQALPGGGGGGKVTLNVMIQGGADPQTAARQMLPALRYALRSLGISVNG